MTPALDLGAAIGFLPLFSATTSLLLVLCSTELQTHSKYAEMIFNEYDIKKRRLTSVLAGQAIAEIC